MSEHSRWSPMVVGRRYGKGLATEAYIQGYILAMEDVLKDIGLARDDEDRDADWYDALLSIGNRVQESLESAKKTLEALDGA